MPKGIKKIKFVSIANEANNSNSKFSPDRWACVPANKKAHFHIKDWHNETTDAQKKGKIYWIVLDKDRKNIVDRLQCMTDKLFSYKIPKNLCGYPYYIEASMTGKPDSNFTGLFLSGYCDPLIVSSAWSRTRGGKTIKNKNSQNFGLSYGEVVHFHARTEGINGEIVIIEVHNEMWNGDYKVRTLYNVEVKDGQINLEIPNTSQWKAHIKQIQDNEEFYVKIKRKNGPYLKDKEGNERHGQYLNIKNQLKAVNKTKPSNQTPLIIGQPKNNIARVGSCTFKQIKITETDEFPVFVDGKTKVKPISTTPLEEKHFVHFDFGKPGLRGDAQSVLNPLISLLKANQHSRIIIDGHADERGPGNYNLKLSQDRSEAIMNFLKSNGLGSSKFECHGHGESQLKHKGANLTEAQHQENRRASIRFNYYENTFSPIVFETIAPFDGKTKKLTVSAVGKERKGCRGSHKDEIKVLDGTISKTEPKNTITYPVSANIGDDFIKNYVLYFGKYINYFSSIHKSYYFYINSCTYYPQKDKPTIHLKTYPDIVWLAHGKYDYEEDYFFHNHSLTLQKGLAPEFESLIDSIYKWTSLSMVDYMAKRVLLDYIKAEAQKIEIGLHAIHNRTQEKKGAALSLTGTTVDFIAQTKYTKYATSAAMYGFVCLQIVVEILILILTRGRSGISKLKKIKKIAKELKKVKKLMDSLPEDVEILGPSMAYRSGLYYYKQADGRIALIWEADLKIEPVVAVEYKKEFDLLDYITDKTVKDKITGKQKQKDFEDIRDKAKGTYEDKLNNIAASISIVGGISIEQNIKYNFLTKSYGFSKQAGNFYDEARGVVAYGQYVKLAAEVKLKMAYEDFIFGLIYHKFEGNLEFKGSALIGLYQSYGKDKEGFYIENYISFSGLKVTLSAKAKLMIIKYTIFDVSTDDEKGKPKEYELLAPDRVRLFKIYLLKI
ncbi:OmpA family protein [Chryseobacterium sp. RP-3-3]|uniref:OmpA family protein n=1 Tax=Chryseobacterium antibioticum TaxID=2728847 RepID=A0A7Y0AR90_9FLAO|nr:OmpA family protein [Chryseobacterium antibioticum]NML72056.1 OmpA family protein [Chryseobacterium antibioticum]